MISSSPDSHTKRKENLEQTQINQPSTTHDPTATPSKHTTHHHSLVHAEVCLFVYWFVSLSVSIEGANFEIIERASRTDSIV
jgi:hypothetical protein